MDPSGEGDQGSVGVVVGSEGDDLVARLEQAQQSRGQGLGGARGDEDLAVGVEEIPEKRSRCAAIASRRTGSRDPAGTG